MGSRTRLFAATVFAVVLLSLPPAWAGGGPKAESQAFEEEVQTRTRPTGKPPSAQPPPTDADAAGKLGTTKMRKANRAAGEILRETMERDRPADLELLNNAGSADLIVVSGDYDRAQDALAAMQVKHVVIPPRLLGQLKLLATQTVMVNCPGQVSRAAIEGLRDFVERGGHLVTTDWALRHLTQRAFPGTVRHNGVRTRDDVLPVDVHGGKEPLLAHLRMHQEKPRWWLEGASFPIEILDRARVSVLVSSEAMKKRYGQAPVVVAFSHGHGRVLHMTSHFYLQNSQLVARREKQKGSAFAKGAGLTDAQVAKLKSKGVDVDEVAVGELNGAYAMQQLSANILVEKQKSNDKLLGDYKAELTQDLTLEGNPGRKGTARLDGKARRGFRVKVLKQDKGRLLIKDLFGNEGWVPEAAVRR